MIEYDDITQTASITGYTTARDGVFTKSELRNAYLSQGVKESDIEDSDRGVIENFLLGAYRGKCDATNDKDAHAVYASKKYKPVALKTRPVYAELPEEFRIK